MADEMDWVSSEITKDLEKLEAKVRKTMEDSKVDSRELVRNQLLHYIMSIEKRD